MLYRNFFRICEVRHWKHCQFSFPTTNQPAQDHTLEQWQSKTDREISSPTKSPITRSNSLVVKSSFHPTIELPPQRINF